MKVTLVIKQYGEEIGAVVVAGEEVPIFSDHYIPLAYNYGHVRPKSGASFGGHVRAYMYRRGMGDFGLLEAEVIQKADWKPESPVATEDIKSVFDSDQNEWSRVARYCYQLLAPCANSDGDYIGKKWIYTTTSLDAPPDLPRCDYCGKRMCGTLSGSTVCEPDGYKSQYSSVELDALREDWNDVPVRKEKVGV